MIGLVRIGRPLDIERDKFGRRSTTSHGWVTEEEWKKIARFQSPLPALPINFPQEFAESLMRDTKRWNEVPWAAEVDLRIRSNPAHGCLWRVDFTATEGDEGGHETVVLGQESLAVLGWWDKWLLRPLARAYCRVANIVDPPLKSEEKIR